MHRYYPGNEEDGGKIRWCLRLKIKKRIPLLSQEGWREAPGWFQDGNLAS
jgi:hypothetical protein